MGRLTILITALALIFCLNKNEEEIKVIIDHIEDGIVSVETKYKNNTQIIEAHTEDFNTIVKEQEKLNFTKIDGRFHCEFKTNYNYKTESVGEEITMYQFKSYDNTVWWVLTEEEIGEVPNFTDTYTFVFYDNGTTTENKPCDCIPEWDCECALYDDIFLGIFKN